MSDPIDRVEILHSMAGLAELLAAYVRELTEQGFTRAEAVTLAIGWQHDVLTRPGSE